jgi:hypothetical protein
MSTTNATMTLSRNSKSRSQVLIAAIALTLAAAVIVLAAWVGIGFGAAPAAPAVEANPFAHQYCISTCCARTAARRQWCPIPTTASASAWPRPVPATRIWATRRWALFHVRHSSGTRGSGR